MFTGFNSFLFFLFSGLNFVTDFFTITFLPEPKLKPGVLELFWTGMDRPGVVPGRDIPCCRGWTESSSDEEIELLECGLSSTLGRLLDKGWFSDPFGLRIDEAVLLILTGFFSPWGGIFLTSFNTLRSSAGSVSKCGDGSKSNEWEKPY